MTTVAGRNFSGTGTLSVVAVQHKSVGPVDFAGSGGLVASLGGADVLRWRFTDPSTGEQWTVPINPNQMSSPHRGKQMVYAHGTHIGEHRIRAVQTPGEIVHWEFGGVIRTKRHHDDLHYWAEKEHEVEISDHLGRTFEVIIEEFRPEDRTPRAEVPWRMTYTMRAMILRRVS